MKPDAPRPRARPPAQTGGRGRAVRVTCTSRPKQRRLVSRPRAQPLGGPPAQPDGLPSARSSSIRNPGRGTAGFLERAECGNRPAGGRGGPRREGTPITIRPGRPPPRLGGPPQGLPQGGGKIGDLRRSAQGRRGGRVGTRHRLVKDQMSSVASRVQFEQRRTNLPARESKTESRKYRLQKVNRPPHSPRREGRRPRVVRRTGGPRDGATAPGG